MTVKTKKSRRARFRGVLASLTAGALLGGGLAAGAAPTPAQADATSVRFDLPEATEWTVPAGVYLLHIEAVGAGGGDSTTITGRTVHTTTGGRGARIQGEIHVTPGDTYTLYGSTRGETSATVPAEPGIGFTDGGKGHHRSGDGAQSAGSGGGGSSAIVDSDGTPLVVAGGGGGAGGYGMWCVSDGGGAGGHAGLDAGGGDGGPCAGGGAGGAGGALDTGDGALGGEAVAGSAGGGGGGGGAGYRGGAGGGGGDIGAGAGGGGGAGSSYVAETQDVSMRVVETHPGAVNGYVRVSYNQVWEDTTTTVTTASGDAPIVGETATLTAAVESADNDQNLPPAGIVYWAAVHAQSNLVEPLGETTLSPGDSGVATATLADVAMPLGATSVTANFEPSDEVSGAFRASRGSIAVLEGTVTTLTAPSEHPWYYPGESYQLEASVTTSSDADIIGEGEAVLIRLGDEVDRAPLNADGTVAFERVVDSPRGQASYRVEYVGTDRFAPSASASAVVPYSYVPTTTEVAVEHGDISYGDTVVTAVEVVPERPLALPLRGPVELYVNDVVVGTEDLNDGKAEIEFTAGTLGDNEVYARYLSDVDLSDSFTIRSTSDIIEFNVGSEHGGDGDDDANGGDGADEDGDQNGAGPGADDSGDGSPGDSSSAGLSVTGADRSVLVTIAGILLLAGAITAVTRRRGRLAGSARGRR